jgi:hypothetical protein
LRFAAQPCAAAVLIARARLADELLDRAIWGHEETAEMMREDGRSFAKRRRLDARLGLAMLARFDRMVETRARARRHRAALSAPAPYNRPPATPYRVYRGTYVR